MGAAAAIGATTLLMTLIPTPVSAAPLPLYPRPINDTGRGIHWSPDTGRWGCLQDDYCEHWDTLWAPRLRAMHIKWVKLFMSPDYMAEGAAKRLIDMGIMPVVRYESKNPQTASGDVLGSIGRLIKLGVRYFETNNEPDSLAEWDKPRPPSGGANGWEALVVRNLITDARAITGMGGCPAFVAFNTGNDEPRTAAQIWVDEGGKDLLENECVWLSIHNYGRGRPINYPNEPVRMFGAPVRDAEWAQTGNVPANWTADQVQQWVWGGMTRDAVDAARAKQATPNVTIDTDITGFRMTEAWADYFTAAGVSAPLPTMMTEGGWVVQDRLDDIYPFLTPLSASALNLDMFKYLQGDMPMTVYEPDNTTRTYSAPPYLMALMPWLAAEAEFDGGAGTWESQAWFSDWWDKTFYLDPPGQLPVIQMLSDLEPKPRVPAGNLIPPEWSARAGCVPPATDVPVGKWDGRLPYLGGNDTCYVKYAGMSSSSTTAGDARGVSAGPTFRVTQVQWQDQGESNPPCGAGYIMFRVLAANGTGIEGVPVNFTHGSTTDTAPTKGAGDDYVGNYAMTATLGTYSVQVGVPGSQSAVVAGLGLGGEVPGSEWDRTSFFVEWQMQAAEGALW